MTGKGLSSSAQIIPLLCLLTLPQAARGDGNPSVVISRWDSRYVEIFNRSQKAVSIAGWSVQHPGRCGGYGLIALDGTLAPGQFHLIETDGGKSFDPDVSGSFISICLVSPGTTIALMRTSAPIIDEWPSIFDAVDLFGFGSGIAADGQPLPRPANGAAQTAVRLEGGCRDTHNNAADFQWAANTILHNSHSPIAPCPTTPIIQPKGVVNAATMVSGPVAPGELLCIFGTNIGPDPGVGPQFAADGKYLATAVAGLQVLFDNAAAPILYASSAQINVVAPFALAGKNQTTLQVKDNGATSASVALPVVAAVPGIFTSLGTGAGQAAALNQDGTINDPYLPDLQGSVVTVYATGAGQTLGPGEDGLITAGEFPSPVQPVTVTIGGQAAQILFAANAPGIVSGVIQVNARIPAGMTGRQQMALKVGNVSSPPVSISVDTGASAPPAYSHLDIQARDIAYDIGTHRLYASIGPGQVNANSIAVIDPSTGNILSRIPSGVGPSKLAISDDGQYLYVALAGQELYDSIERISITTGRPDFTVRIDQLYSDAGLNLGPQEGLKVVAMQAIPGSPRSLAVAVTNYSGDRIAPAIVIDDNVRRPALGGPARSLAAASAVLLYGDQRTYYVGPQGLMSGPLYPATNSAFSDPVAPAGGFAISSAGFVMPWGGSDVLATLATPPIPGDFAYRPDTGLAYYAGAFIGAENFVVQTYDLQTYRLVGQFLRTQRIGSPVDFPVDQVKLVSAGKAGLVAMAAHTPGIYVIPLAAIQPLAAPVLPKGPLSSNGIQRFAIPSNSMAASPAGDRLYLSIPSVFPGIGNSVVTYDVAAGQFEDPVWVGSEPDALAVSSDGQHLHVSLDGAMAIKRLSLPSLSTEKQFHVFTSGVAPSGAILRLRGRLSVAAFLLSLPSNPASIIASAIEPRAFVPGDAEVIVYDDSLPRPETNYTATLGVPTRIPGVYEIQLSDDGAVLFGEDGSHGGAQLTRWLITPRGLQFDAPGASFGGLYLDLKCQHSLCVTGSGSVADTNTLEVVAQLGGSGGFGSPSLALPDLDNNRIFIAAGGITSPASVVIKSFDARTRKLLGEYEIPKWLLARSFQKIAGERLAISNGNELILLPISLLQPK